MKTMRYLPLALLITIPSISHAEYEGEVNIGLRTTHFADGEKSAKYDEYDTKNNGLFGSGWVLFDTDDYRIDASLDASGFEISGNRFGLLKGKLYFNDYTHYLSKNALTPALGMGSDYLLIPDADVSASVPPVSAWADYDYEIDKTIVGGNVTVDTESPFYYKVSFEQQQSDGSVPYGLINFSDFELAMPIDYTTNILTAESGYRSKETTVVLGLGYSGFDNDNNLLTTFDGNETQEYGVAPDNYSYNLSARLKQKLPMNSLLAMKASYTQNISDPDFSDYTTVTLPNADDDYDGDVQYIRANLALTTRFDANIDTRLFYNYTDRNNDSDEITATDNGAENELYEYTKNQAGFDFNYRFDKYNKLHSGYEFTDMDRTREDADSSTDNLLFGQLKNTSLDWMSTQFRLEYMNRDTDADYRADTLSGDGLIHEYFTPFDVASKDRYKGKLSFEFYPMEGLDLGVSYAFVYDDYDADLGVQSDERHEFYVDANMVMKSKIKFNTYAGYEYTYSDFDSRRYNPGGADPSSPVTSNNYNWNQESTYDFFVIGGNVTVPVLHNLDMVMSADYQLVDGNIDFYRSIAAGAPLEKIKDADDYYKTQLGIKGIYKATDSMSFTVGYQFEMSNLDEWKYENYTYTPGSDYLSGAGLDSDYETHQFFVIGTYTF